MKQYAAGVPPQPSEASVAIVQPALPCAKSPFWMGDVNAAEEHVSVTDWVLVTVATVVYTV